MPCRRPWNGWAPPSRRALHAAVALGCVTESLSTALLVTLRPRVEHPVVRDALDVILEDEIRHGRLGWAHLSDAAAREDVSWLAAHVPAMIDDALAGEAGLSLPHGGADLGDLGILDRETSQKVAREVIATTIVPGLARSGIVVSAPV